MARRKAPARRDNLELAELEQMEKDENQNRAKKDSKYPTGRYVKNYTSGTMHRAETGRYMSAKWVNPYTGEERPATIGRQGSRRPASHGKTVGTGSARVSKGTVDKTASALRPIPGGYKRGVGNGNSDDSAWRKDLATKKARKKADVNNLKPPRRVKR